MHSLAIASEEFATFRRLPKAVQDEVTFWRQVVADVVASKLPICEAFAAVAKGRGLKEGTVRKKYYAARKAGWRGLINEARLGDAKAKVPSEFLDYWHGLVLENKRNTAKAHSRFIAAYHRGEPIPGLPPANERAAHLPAGFSLRNLVRARYLPPKAALTMARLGVAEARKHLPMGPQDISAVRPLEFVVFDDVELDFLIVVPESPTPVKVRLIVAMDLCSRVILGYGVRPAITRPDGVEDGLKLKDMKMVVARLLRTWGIPQDYTMTLIVENATAAIPPATELALAEISAGRIVVSRTSMIVGQVFEFRDRATGNSFGKAWLESFFGSLHAETADQPGYKGRRYDLAPAELDGRRKELAALVRAGKSLPLELRYEFRYPFLNAAEALQELDAALARLHARSTHRLLYFDEIAVWQMTPDDKPKYRHEMPEWLVPNAGQLIWTTRMESPMERFTRFIGQVDRSAVADCALQRLMDEHKRVKFADLQFAFERNRVDYVYVPTDAMLSLLTEGQHYCLWFHPDEMAQVYVTRDFPHLGYVGKLSRFTAGRRGELEDTKAYLRDKQRLFAHAQAAAQQPAIKRMRQRGDDLAANTEIIREGLRTMEIEVDVVAPSAGPIPADAPDSVRMITGDLQDRAAAAAARRQQSRDQERRMDSLTEDEMAGFFATAPTAGPGPDPTEEPEEDLSALL